MKNKKNKFKLIGGKHIHKGYVKLEYKDFFKDDNSWVTFWKSEDEIKIEIISSRDAVKDLFSGLKKVGKIDWDKPTDTSNWNSPGKKDFENELMERCICCEILDRESKVFNAYDIERELLISILFTQSPGKEGTIGFQNIHIGDNIMSIYRILGNKEKSRYLMDLIQKKMPSDERRDHYKKWKIEQVKGWFSDN